MDFRRVIGSRQGQNLLFRNLFHTLNTCGVRDIAPKEKYLKLLEFRHFERHVLFSQSDRKEKKKAISNGVNVQVVVKV